MNESSREIMLITFPHLLVLAALRLDVYPNSAFFGPPTNTTTVPSLDVTLDALAGSAEISGTLVHSANASYAFDCSFAAGYIAFVWFDDHLICHTTPIPFGNSISSTDGNPAYPLPFTAGTTSTVVVRISSASIILNDEGHHRTTMGEASVRVRWSALKRAVAHDAKLDYHGVPPSALHPDLPSLEKQRRALQDGLKTGWNLWGYNLLGLVRLPQSHVLTLALCQLSTAKCLNETRIEDTKATIRVGPFATDASYFQFHVAFAGINVSLSVVGGDGRLSVLADPVGCESTNCSDYALVLLPRFQWYREGTINVSASDGTIAFSPLGFPTSFLRPTRPPMAALSHSVTKALGGVAAVGTTSVLRAALSLGGGPVGIREGGRDVKPPTVEEVTATVASARRAELARYKAYGALAEVKEALQAATMWNYILSPAELGPILPVSRSWNFVKQEASVDWGYVVRSRAGLNPTTSGSRPVLPLLVPCPAPLPRAHAAVGGSRLADFRLGQFLCVLHGLPRPPWARHRILQPHSGRALAHRRRLRAQFFGRWLQVR